MNLDFFVARTQARLATILIVALVLVIGSLITLAAFGKSIADPLVQLISTLAVGLLTLVGQPVAYLFNRQRSANADGAPDETRAIPNPPASSIGRTGTEPAAGG